MGGYEIRNFGEITTQTTTKRTGPVPSLDCITLHCIDHSIAIAQHHTCAMLDDPWI